MLPHLHYLTLVFIIPFCCYCFFFIVFVFAIVFVFIFVNVNDKFYPVRARTITRRSKTLYIYYVCNSCCCCHKGYNAAATTTTTTNYIKNSLATVKTNKVSKQA